MLIVMHWPKRQYIQSKGISIKSIGMKIGDFTILDYTNAFSSKPTFSRSVLQFAKIHIFFDTDAFLEKFLLIIMA